MRKGVGSTGNADPFLTVPLKSIRNQKDLHQVGRPLIDHDAMEVSFGVEV